jgi:hypothetical protein
VARLNPGEGEHDLGRGLLLSRRFLEAVQDRPDEDEGVAGLRLREGGLASDESPLPRIERGHGRHLLGDEQGKADVPVPDSGLLPRRNLPGAGDPLRSEVEIHAGIGGDDDVGFGGRSDVAAFNRGRERLTGRVFTKFSREGLVPNRLHLRALPRFPHHQGGLRQRGVALGDPRLHFPAQRTGVDRGLVRVEPLLPALAGNVDILKDSTDVGRGGGTAPRFRAGLLPLLHEGIGGCGRSGGGFGLFGDLLGGEGNSCEQEDGEGGGD